MPEIKTSRPYEERFLDGYERHALKEEVQKVKPSRRLSLRKKTASWALGASLVLGGFGIPLAKIGLSKPSSSQANQPRPAPAPAPPPSTESGIAQDLATALAAEFPGGVTVRYNLHPPFLRALGMTRKLKLGKWFDGVFRLLVGLRRLRGTALDPFGYAEVRRVERALPGEYRALVEKALVSLSPETYEAAVKLANLPDVIRGYEAIKLRNVQRFRDGVRALGF